MPKSASTPSLKHHARERSAPPTARRTVRAFGALAVLAVVWANVTEIPEMAFATGTLQPTGHLRRVEHLDGGVVERILIAEGDTIDVGQPLVRLTQDDVEAEFESLRVRESVLIQAIDRSRLVLTAIGFSPDFETRQIFGSQRAAAQAAVYEARRTRLAQTLEGASQRVAAFETSVSSLDDLQTIEARELTRLQSLHTMGLARDQALYTAEIQTNASQRELLGALAALRRAEADLQDADAALQEHYSTQRDTLLSDIDTAAEELSLVQRAIVNNRLRRDRIQIDAPVSGVVQALYLSVPGEVVEPGGLVAEVLPNTERLIAELRLRPSDIGHIDISDPVEINLTTFNTKRYGVLNGWVTQISPTSTENENRETYFLVRVEFDGQSIGEGEEMRQLRAGMEVNASVRTGSRTVMEYVLGPLLIPFSRAFSER